MLKFGITLLLMALVSSTCVANEVRIATASNFLTVLKKIKKPFENKTGILLLISSGSTAKLYSQIKHGAPYDVFLAADEVTTKRLIGEHLAVAQSQFVFAQGKLVLWGGLTRNTNQPSNDLSKMNFKRLAIANPKLAPYGLAAMEVLRYLGIDEKINEKLVFGENIGQAFQFIYSGNADLGFVALSQLISSKAKGNYWHIPSRMYQPLRQSAVLLNRAKTNKNAQQFMQFLKSQKVQQAIATKYGYTSVLLPNSVVR